MRSKKLPLEAREGPEPCNTGPSKCKGPTKSHSQDPVPTQVRVVAHGVDACYTTYQGELREEILEALEILKGEAQDDDAPAHLPSLKLFGESVVVHRGGGVRGFTYHVSNSKCDAFLVGRGKNQPELWIQPRAEYIHEVGILQVLAEQEESVLAMFMHAPKARANRLDLHVDLVGVTWRDFGLALTDTGLTLKNATTRGREIQTHTTGKRMTGFCVGKRGGSIYLRAYDKTVELQQQGHLKALSEGEVTHYVPVMWKENGWRGQTGVDKQGRPVFESVVRLEIELGRDALKTFLTRTGKNDGFVDDWDRALIQLNAIWQYCLRDWFTVRVPGTASQKCRWEVAEWWQRLMTLPMGEGPQVPGARVCQRSSSVRKLVQVGAGVLISLGALDGLPVNEAVARFVNLLTAEVAGKYTERVRKKTNQWRTRIPEVHLAGGSESA